jgi:hypothetical protein
MRRNTRSVLLVLASAAICARVSAADPEASNDSPPAQCLGQGELAAPAPPAFDDYPELDVTRAELVANCAADKLRYAFAVEGVCLDGTRLLNYGTGFVSEMRLYTAEGKFEGLLAQTDHGSVPCQGQTFWPRYVQCEVPVVVTKLCDFGLLEAGEPAFFDRWQE